MIKTYIIGGGVPRTEISRWEDVAEALGGAQDRKDLVLGGVRRCVEGWDGGAGK